MDTSKKMLTSYVLFFVSMFNASCWASVIVVHNALFLLLSSMTQASEKKENEEGLSSFSTSADSALFLRIC
jgi:hypothetical protein